MGLNPYWTPKSDAWFYAGLRRHSKLRNSAKKAALEPVVRELLRWPGQVHGTPCGPPIQWPGGACHGHSCLTCPGGSGFQCPSSTTCGPGGTGGGHGPGCALAIPVPSPSAAAPSAPATVALPANFLIFTIAGLLSIRASPTGGVRTAEIGPNYDLNLLMKAYPHAREFKPPPAATRGFADTGALIQPSWSAGARRANSGACSGRTPTPTK